MATAFEREGAAEEEAKPVDLPRYPEFLLGLRISDDIVHDGFMGILT